MVTGSSAKAVTSGFGQILRGHRDFRWFWAGQSISAVGTQVTAVALPLTATLTLGTGPAGVSAIATAAFLPNVALPLVVGHWLETRRRRRVMVVADLVRVAAVGAVPIAAVAHALSVQLLVAVALSSGSAAVVFDIASFAYLPTIVSAEQLPAANQATQAAFTAAQVAGPGLAGVLIEWLRPAVAIAVDAISYLASALGVAIAQAPEPSPAAQDRPGRILDGLREIFASPVLRRLTAHAAAYNAAAQMLTVNLVVYAVSDRDVSPGLFGLALMAAGLGAFLGTLGALRLSRRLGYGHTFAVSLALSTGTPLLIAAIPAGGLAFAGLWSVIEVVSGMGLGSANVLSVTLRQVVAPRGSLARTNGGYRLLIFGVLPIGSALGGLVGATLGSRVGVTIGAAGLAVSALPMLQAPVRKLRDPSDAAVPLKAC